MRLLLSHGGATELGRLSVTSDAAWVSATVDTANRAVVLSFTTANLTNRTLTIGDGTVSSQFFVRATIATLNIVTLVDDPVRSRTYGIQQDGANLGSVVVIDPITLNPINNITTGRRPTDLAISADGNEMLVINAAEKSISAINLRTLAVAETISLGTYYDWSTSGETSGHVKYGPGNLVYYVDGSWGPVLHVFNRGTRSVLQSIFFNGNAYSGAGNASEGFGDLVLTPDETQAFGWAQYGLECRLGGFERARSSRSTTPTAARHRGSATFPRSRPSDRAPASPPDS